MIGAPASNLRYTADDGTLRSRTNAATSIIASNANYSRIPARVVPFAHLSSGRTSARQYRSQMTSDPRSTYARLLAERRADIAAREARHRNLGRAKIAVAGAGVAIVWLALSVGGATILWVLLPAAVFVALVVIHEKLLAETERRRRSARFFEKGIARLDGNWAGTGESGERYNDPAHPYALDLDLFGKGSVFELLCTARTQIGEDRLAEWLKFPAPPDEVAARQQAVSELRDRLDLREELAIVAEEARHGVAPEALAHWGEAPARLRASGFRLKVRLFTTIGIAAFIALWVHLLRTATVLHFSAKVDALLLDFLLVALLINGWFLYRHNGEMGAAVSAVEEAAHELGLLSEVLVRMEREQFTCPLLAELRASLDAEGEPPSRRLARLKRLVEYLDSRDNVFVRVLEPFVMWTPHLALKVEDWRAHSGTAVRRWLHAAGEMEALCSLASHAFEHPADPFPEFAATGPCIDGDALGHPLIPEDRVVRNSIQLGGKLRVLVVSGSNMSGKSTFLRTLGVNIVLAQAGAPVRAQRLRISPLAVGASIRLTDSLQGGVSRFYAEILRLRQILDETQGPLPVLFLIDEFLHGTNSHDRRIGAEALVRGLVERGAIGLITTHDLALAEIADQLGERAANVHFEDQIVDGEIRFDYHMRPGVVRKSNAIELMRQVGLEI
ncbi:MAG: mismatch repair protein MutS domain protein [Candidatus Solibacter sp.]|nr:mismatch repair protein MutS domain protein [Candidatus Solibacter sp.]